MSGSFSFRDLSITKKIHAITVIAVVVFIVPALINYNAMTANRTALEELKSSSYKTVQLTISNKVKLRKLDELYIQAATFGEAERITEATEMKQDIEQSLNQLSSLNSHIEVKDDLALLNSYYTLSDTIARGMVDGSGSFNPEDAKTKTANFNDLVKYFDEMEKEADARFVELVESTLSRSESAQAMVFTISIALLILLLILAIAIEKMIATAASEAAGSLHQLATGGGSLSSQLKVRAQDEIGQVAIHFNAFTKILKQAVMEVMAVTKPMTTNANELMTKMQTAQANMQRQQEDSDVVRQSMEEMIRSVEEISSSAASASSAAQVAEQEVAQSEGLIKSSIDTSSRLSGEVENAATTINKLSDHTQNVTQILGVITSIAEQTNLLALNAAIEAARAGEQGRGFAVVADEVRELASRTSKSTNEIGDFLSKLTSASADAVSVMNTAQEMAKDNTNVATETGTSVGKISEQILSINNMNMQIAAATEEQSSMATVVMDNVSSMKQSFDEIMTSLNSIDEVANHLNALSENLVHATSKFKV